MGNKSAKSAQTDIVVTDDDRYDVLSLYDNLKRTFYFSEDGEDFAFASPFSAEQVINLYIDRIEQYRDTLGKDAKQRISIFYKKEDEQEEGGKEYAQKKAAKREQKYLLLKERLHLHSAADLFFQASQKAGHVTDQNSGAPVLKALREGLRHIEIVGGFDEAFDERHVTISSMGVAAILDVLGTKIRDHQLYNGAVSELAEIKAIFHRMTKDGAGLDALLLAFHTEDFTAPKKPAKIQMALKKIGVIFDRAAASGSFVEMKADGGIVFDPKKIWRVLKIVSDRIGIGEEFKNAREHFVKIRDRFIVLLDTVQDKALIDEITQPPPRGDKKKPKDAKATARLAAE